jgi:hypothetical protein
MKLRIVVISLILIMGSVLPCAAGQMIPGIIYSLKDGGIINCSIEYSNGQGKMEAQNPQTGEKFTGIYTGVFMNELMAKCKGILIGDKGTIISLTMEINIGNAWNLPFGYGDGEDNNNIKYQYHTLRK